MPQAVMQSHLLLSKPIPIKGSSGRGIGFGFSSAADWTNPSARPHRRSPLVISSSASEINSSVHHNAVLGLSWNATSAHARRASRVFAHKSHPDVKKDSQVSEKCWCLQFSLVVPSNSVGTQNDQELKSQEDADRPHGVEWDPSSKNKKWAKFYSWAFRWGILHIGFWKGLKFKEGYSPDKEEDTLVEEGSTDERGPSIQVLGSVLLSLLLLQTFGPRVSLTYSSLMAMLDEELDSGYKFGHVIAWILGGRSGVLLSLCLSFAPWVFKKLAAV